MAENRQRVGFLACIPDILTELGAEPATVLTKAGLERDALCDPEANIGFGKTGHLIQLCADYTHCPYFGFLLGQRAGALALGLIGELMAHARTLGVALNDLVRHQHRHARGSAVYLLHLGDNALFGHVVYESNIEGAMQLNDSAIAIGFNLIRRALGASDMDGAEILLSRSEPTHAEAYKRWFGVRVRFDSGYSGILLPRRWLDRPVVGADPVLHEALEKRVQTYWRFGEPDIATRLRAAISVGLLSGRISGAEFSHQLGIARRTLHRRLSAHGVSFQHILDEIRFEFAKQLLGNTALDVGHVSLVLRYADPSVFTHAFARWSGLTPSQWRRASRSHCPFAATAT